MSITLLILLTSFVAFSVGDPLPTGGANCTSILQCGKIGSGFCIDDVCYCTERFGNPDCSYERKSKSLAGGLQFLCFVGVPGVGEYILGHTLYGVGQMILMYSGIIIGIIQCFIVCVSKGSIKSLTFLTAIASCAGLAGFFWSIARGAMILQDQVLDSNRYSLY